MSTTVVKIPKVTIVTNATVETMETNANIVITEKRRNKGNDVC
jgi:hypothetical protein